jgi:hypothetical protein
MVLIRLISRLAVGHHLKETNGRIGFHEIAESFENTSLNLIRLGGEPVDQTACHRDVCDAQIAIDLFQFCLGGRGDHYPENDALTFGFFSHAALEVNRESRFALGETLITANYVTDCHFYRQGEAVISIHETARWPIGRGVVE